MAYKYYEEEEEYVPQPRRRRKKRFGRRLLFWLFLFAVLLTAYKATNGFSHLGVIGGAPKNNIVTDFNVDLAVLAGSMGGGDFEASESDLAALRTVAEKNPEYREKIEFFIENVANYDQGAVNTVLLAPEKTDYVLLAPFAAETPAGTWDVTVKKGTVPFFIQYDSRWAFHNYGSGPMGDTACGPTCLSMALAGLTGDGTLTPDVVADYAESAGYYVPGVGTAWSIFTGAAEHYGVRGEEIALSQTEMKDRLRNGEVLIASVTPGDFTMAGHFIVIHGTTVGGFSVYDPSSIERSGMAWSYDKLAPQIAAIWSLRAA